MGSGGHAARGIIAARSTTLRRRRDPARRRPRHARPHRRQARRRRDRSRDRRPVRAAGRRSRRAAEALARAAATTGRVRPSRTSAPPTAWDCPGGDRHVRPRTRGVRCPRSRWRESLAMTTKRRWCSRSSMQPRPALGTRRRPSDRRAEAAEILRRLDVISVPGYPIPSGAAGAVQPVRSAEPDVRVGAELHEVERAALERRQDDLARQHLVLRDDVAQSSCACTLTCRRGRPPPSRNGVETFGAVVTRQRGGSGADRWW